MDDLSPDEWLSEQRRLGMVDLYDELEEFRGFLVGLLYEVRMNPETPIAQHIETFMDNNSESWYGGDGDHWSRHLPA